MTEPSKTYIQIIDPTDGAGHMGKQVRINGMPVLTTTDIKVKVGMANDKEFTRVTLTILATGLELIHE